MPSYRAYRLDDAGNCVSCSEFDAPNDSDALEVVRVLPEQLGFEIWCGTTMVGRIGRNDKEISLDIRPGHNPGPSQRERRTLAT